MSLVAGLDIGTRAAKAVVLDGDRVVATGRVRTRPDFPAIAREALEAAASAAGVGVGDVSYVATTGFGRYSVPFRDLQITEITCVAQGALFLFPGTRSVLDVGAQSTRAIKVLPTGRVKEFKTNDKCAAGAGGFLERAARYLEISLPELGAISLRADKPQPISSVCAVLAESEIINHVSAGQSVENIVCGIHNALASRAMALLARIGLEPDLALVGGVARQAGMVKALQEASGMAVNVPEDPEIVAALGAALLARKRLARRGAA